MCAAAEATKEAIVPGTVEEDKRLTFDSGELLQHYCLPDNRPRSQVQPTISQVECAMKQRL